MTGGMHYTPSHANVSKFYNFQVTFSQLIFHLKSWNLAGLPKVKVLFLVLVFVFNFDLFKFSAAILEKGLLMAALNSRKIKVQKTRVVMLVIDLNLVKITGKGLLCTKMLKKMDIKNLIIVGAIHWTKISGAEVRKFLGVEWIATGLNGLVPFHSHNEFRAYIERRIDVGSLLLV